MSVQPEASERESVDLPHHGDLAFAALMDALAPEGEGESGSAAPAGDAAAGAGANQPGADPKSAGGNTSPAGGSAPVTGNQAPPAGGAPADGGGDAKAGSAAQQPAPGSGEPSAGSAEQPPAVSGTADLPADWTASADDYIPKLGQLSTKFEENTTKAYQQQAYDQARKDYEKYFEALEKHPRLLVGTQVPAIGKEGMDVLRDSNDAKEWQEAVRSLLVAEIQETAKTKMEESRDFLETVHASIDLFKNNRDLIPGTKNFDRELADTFAEMMKPYEVRVEGKLQGYSIPVQPIIDSLRGQLTTRRKAAPPAAPHPVNPPTGQQAEPPQAGIQSKAGNTSEVEDFSVLFGTIGLPNLQI